MIRVMFDSTAPGAIPSWASMVAGYIDGDYAWPADAWVRFAHAQQVRVNVTGDPAHGGDCLDVESGDATPAHAPAWWDARHAAGARFLAIYCSRSSLPAVDAAMGTRPYYRWVATLDGSTHVEGYPPMRGPAAVQFAGSGLTGAPVDLSIVWESGWHPAPFRAAPAGALADARQLAVVLGQVRSGLTQMQALDEAITRLLGD